MRYFLSKCGPWDNDKELEKNFSKAVDFDDSFECIQVPFKTFFISEAEILMNKITQSNGQWQHIENFSQTRCFFYCHIFNYILTSNSYPSSWKLSYISPIPKTKPTQIDKLRPISLLPTISKVLKRLYLNQLQEIIVPHIKKDQFGFMQNCLTTVCLLHIQETTSVLLDLSLIHIWRCRRSTLCRSRWSPDH